MRRTLTLLVTFFLATAGMTLLATAGPARAAAKEPIRIEAQAAVTGLGSESGRQAREGLLLAEADLNVKGGLLDRPVKILLPETRGYPGPVVVACRILAGERGVPLLAAGDANPWLVRVGEDAALVASALVEAVVKSGHRRVALLYRNDEPGASNRDLVVAALQRRDLTSVAVESHRPGDRDFTAQLLNVQKSGAEALIVLTGEEEQALLTRRVNQLAPDLAYYGSPSLGQASAIALAQGAAEGKFTVLPYAASNPDPLVQAFVKRFRARFGHPPGTLAALYYDAAMLVARAIEKGKSDKPGDIRDNLKKLKAFPGVSGLDYTVNGQGEAVHELFLVKVVNGSPQVIRKIEG